MKRKILNILLIGIMILNVVGCGQNKTNKNDGSNEDTNIEEKEVSINKGDNEELVDTLNNIISELYEENKVDGSFSLALYNISDRLKEKKINKYTFTAICDKEFNEKPNITGYTSPLEKWTSDAKYIENYDGKCNYNTWAFTEYNKGKDYNVLVLDTDNNYYSVKLSFKKIKFRDKDRYYPTFSDSKLLK